MGGQQNPKRGMQRTTSAASSEGNFRRGTQQGTASGDPASLATDMRSQAYAGNLAAQNAERGLARLEEVEESHRVHFRSRDPAAYSYNGQGSMEEGPHSTDRSLSGTGREPGQKETGKSLSNWVVNMPIITPGSLIARSGDMPRDKSRDIDEELVGDSEPERLVKAMQTRSESEPQPDRDMDRVQPPPKYPSTSRIPSRRVVHAASSDEDEDTIQRRKQHRRPGPLSHAGPASSVGEKGKRRVKTEGKRYPGQSTQGASGPVAPAHSLKGPSTFLLRGDDLSQSQLSQSRIERQDIPTSQEPPEPAVDYSQDVVPETQLTSSEKPGSQDVHSPKIQYERELAASQVAPVVTGNNDPNTSTDISTRALGLIDTESDPKSSRTSRRDISGLSGIDRRNIPQPDISPVPHATNADKSGDLDDITGVSKSKKTSKAGALQTDSSGQSFEIPDGFVDKVTASQADESANTSAPSHEISELSIYREQTSNEVIGRVERVNIEENIVQEQTQKSEINRKRGQKRAKVAVLAVTEAPRSSRLGLSPSSKNQQLSPQQTPRRGHASDEPPSRLFGSSPLTSITTSHEASHPKAPIKSQRKSYTGKRTIRSEVESTQPPPASDEQEENEVEESLGFLYEHSSQSLDPYGTRANPTKVVEPPVPKKPTRPPRPPPSANTRSRKRVLERSPPPNDAASASKAGTSQAGTSQRPSKRRRKEQPIPEPPLTQPEPEPVDQDSANRSPPPPPAESRKGRVFALWKKHYFTAKVTDFWEATEGEPPAEASNTKSKAKGKSRSKSKEKSKAKENITMPSEIVCRIEFDDGISTMTPLRALYRCELREGDEIKVPGKRGGKLGRTATVHSVTSWPENETVEARPSTSPKEIISVVAKDLAVSAEVVEANWEDRSILSLQEIGLGDSVEKAAESGRAKKATTARTPRVSVSTAVHEESESEAQHPPITRQPGHSPPRVRKAIGSSADDHPSAPPAKRRNIERLSPVLPDEQRPYPFRGHAFIIALAMNRGDTPINVKTRGTEKAELVETIKRLGGRVIKNGFEDLIDWGGQFSDDGKRWIWTKGSITYSDPDQAPTSSGKKGKGPAPNPESIFLVADGANRNAKYMLALATGIPCVDKGWILDEVRQI
ncbi:hypothetical protein CPB86DRAFT_339784 [Serendipita vermifera]|nr:hypothetical protein CPB86DRAFT_339784 [Serendipita vermifera]